MDIFILSFMSNNTELSKHPFTFLASRNIAEIRAVNDRRVLPLEILAKSRRDKHKIAT